MVKKYGRAFYQLAQFVAYVHNAAVDENFLKHQKDRECLAVTVGEAASLSKELGLEQSGLFVGQLVEDLQNASPAEVFTKDVLVCLDRVLRNELESVWFKNLSNSQAMLYRTKEPFGEKAATKLHKATLDIEEAGKCLALERPTACVFHLMRVMERAVQKFGKKLGIQHVELKDWQTILDQLNGPIRALPEKTMREKNKKRDYLHAHTNLFNVKFVWRNPVMHPHVSYTLEQAHEIYDAVKVFTANLSEVL